MGLIIIFNRRVVFGLVSLVVFILGFMFLSQMPIRGEAQSWAAFLLLIGVSLGCAYLVSRRFPPTGKQL